VEHSAEGKLLDWFLLYVGALQHRPGLELDRPKKLTAKSPVS
jgi:hypothetical protein